MRLVACILVLFFSASTVWSFQGKSFQQQIPSSARLDTNRGWVELRGIGVARHYAQDVYAGAFYSFHPDRTPQEALNDPEPKRMLFLILSQTPPFNELIIESLKLNNAPKLLKLEQVRISRFLQLIDKNYSIGDVITFDYIPKVGTQIMVNNLSLGVIDGDEFYTVLLKMWMGRQPPSIKFREDLFSILNAPTIVN